jgi:hypothetical protein
MELRISRCTAESRLIDRIQKGNDLKNIRVNSWEELKSVESNYKKWNDFNKELLKKIFTSSEIADEYSQEFFFAFGTQQPPSLAEETEDLHDLINKKITKLESRVEQLELCDLDREENQDRPETIAVKTQASTAYSSREIHQLEQKKQSLQSEWDIRYQKLTKLRQALAIESGTAIKFQLEQQIKEEEAQLQKLEKELNEIDRKLDQNSDYQPVEDNSVRDSGIDVKDDRIAQNPTARQSSISVVKTKSTPTRRSLQPKKSTPRKSANDLKQSREIDRLLSIVTRSSSNITDIINALTKLGRMRLTKGDSKVITVISNLLVFPKNLSVSIAAVETLSKVAKGDSTAIRRVTNLWKNSIDLKLKKAIINCLGAIAEQNSTGINKLISILRVEKDSPIIQLVASNLGNIAFGNRNAIQALETKLRFVPATPKILRKTLAKNLEKIDPGNSLAARYR